MVCGCSRHSPFSPASPALLLPSPTTGLCPPNDSSNPHFPSALQNHQPVGQNSCMSISLSGIDNRFYGCHQASCVLGMNRNFRGERRDGRKGLIFHCLGREDSGLSPHCCAVGEIKAAVDMVGIVGKEGSIQPSRAVSICISHAW